MREYFSLLIYILLYLSGHSQPKRFSFTESKMGSPFTIILYASDSLEAKAVSANCFRLVDSLVSIFSDYIDSSELNRLSATAGTNTNFQCSPALFNIIVLSRNAYEKSKGSFDITLGSLTRLWRKARKDSLFPDPDQVKEKLALTGFHKLILDLNAKTVNLTVKGMLLDLGGIGQGYIGQRVIDFLKEHQIVNALVDVSGDIICIGKPPGKKNWTIAVNVPESKEELLPKNLGITNKSVTTSGDVYQYMEHNGKKYSHIIDPATGYGMTTGKNVTVIANDGATADWFTKACSILPYEESKKIAAALHAEFLIAEIKNGRIFYHKSAHFSNYWKSP